MLYDYSAKLPSQLRNARLHNVGVWANRCAVRRYLHQHAADAAARDAKRGISTNAQIAALNAQHGSFVESRLDTSRLHEVAAAQEASRAVALGTASLWPLGFRALATLRPVRLPTHAVLVASYAGGTGVAATPQPLLSHAPAAYCGICVPYGLVGFPEYRAQCAARTLAAGGHDRLATCAQAVALDYALWAAAWGTAAAMRHPDAGLEACIMHTPVLRQAAALGQTQGALEDACARAAPMLAAAFGMSSRQALYARLITASRSAPLRKAAKYPCVLRGQCRPRTQHDAHLRPTALRYAAAPDVHAATFCAAGAQLAP